MTQNLISQTVTDAQRDAMPGDLGAFDTKFTGFKAALDAADIAKPAKISESDIAALEMALAATQFVNREAVNPPTCITSENNSASWPPFCAADG
ncbi:MAG: hypothetical protein HY300_08570 [Verrucomicrobia bacterium]|nr:hypothetical protein [Verrucomicrobiota bacterium]